MSGCHFFGTAADLEVILDRIFSHKDWMLVERASRHDLPLRWFRSVEEVTEAFQLDDEIVLLAVYSESMRGNVFAEHFTFDPRRVRGAKGRSDIAGWGLVHIDFMGRRRGSILSSYVGVRSLGSAKRYEATTLRDELGPVDAWDWREVERIASHLTRFIRRSAVDKAVAGVILPGAATAAAEGVELVPS